jgi:hypothetical protein
MATRLRSRFACVLWTLTWGSAPHPNVEKRDVRIGGPQDC